MAIASTNGVGGTATTAETRPAGPNGGTGGSLFSAPPPDHDAKPGGPHGATLGPDGKPLTDRQKVSAMKTDGVKPLTAFGLIVPVVLVVLAVALWFVNPTAAVIVGLVAAGIALLWIIIRALAKRKSNNSRGSANKPNGSQNNNGGRARNSRFNPFNRSGRHGPNGGSNSNGNGAGGPGGRNRRGWFGNRNRRDHDGERDRRGSWRDDKRGSGRDDKRGSWRDRFRGNRNRGHDNPTGGTKPKGSGNHHDGRSADDKGNRGSLFRRPDGSSRFRSPHRDNSGRGRGNSSNSGGSGGGGRGNNSSGANTGRSSNGSSGSNGSGSGRSWFKPWTWGSGSGSGSGGGGGGRSNGGRSNGGHSGSNSGGAGNGTSSSGNHGGGRWYKPWLWGSRQHNDNGGSGDNPNSGGDGRWRDRWHGWWVDNRDDSSSRYRNSYDTNRSRTDNSDEQKRRFGWPNWSRWSRGKNSDGYADFNADGGGQPRPRTWAYSQRTDQNEPIGNESRGLPSGQPFSAPMETGESQMPQNEPVSNGRVTTTGGGGGGSGPVMDAATGRMEAMAHVAAATVTQGSTTDNIEMAARFRRVASIYASSDDARLRGLATLFFRHAVRAETVAQNRAALTAGHVAAASEAIGGTSSRH